MMLQEARDQYLQRKKDWEQKQQADVQEREERDVANAVFASIQRHGMAVLEKYVKPFPGRPQTWKEHLRILNQRFNPYAQKGDVREMWVLARSEGEPEVEIHLSGTKDSKGSQELRIHLKTPDMYINEIKEQLVIRKDEFCNSSWCVLVPSQYSTWRGELVEDYDRHKLGQQLKEAARWRGLLDDILQIHPIDRASMH